MVAELTPTELTLLGLLVEKPRHGYELDEVISARGMREWTEIGFSSIYYLLGRLRDRGLITEIDTPRPVRGKSRKVYGPTAEGRRACARSAEAAVENMPAPAASSLDDGAKLRDASRQLIEKTLAACGGNVSRAARELGVSRGLIYRHVKQAPAER